MPCASSEKFSQTISPMPSIEFQLWNERCVTLLTQQMAEYLTAYLQDEQVVTPESVAQAELALVRQVATGLSHLLENAPVAIALPLPNSPTTELFVLTHGAGGERSPLLTWTLPKGKQLTFNQGQQIHRSDFTQLQTQIRVDSSGQSPYRLCEICLEHCEAWLLIGDASSAMSVEASQRPASFSQPTLERIAHQCAVTLGQIRLISAQRQHSQTLWAKNQELEQTNQLKNEFLANTSHEIRTPLSSILGFTHLLQQQGFDPLNLRHQEYLKIILSSGQHLLALMNDILDLSKIEANQMTLQWETVDIQELCQVCLTLVREKASDKGLRLQLELDPTLKTFKADGLRLKQMLFNLLSNAIKFTVRGSVGLQVLAIKGQVHFTVWDDGTGISPEQQALLFKPYSQIANVAVCRTEGTGLGLVLTQKLAELHGGRIEVRSELHQGSRFTVVLPVSQTGCKESVELDEVDGAENTPQLDELKLDGVKPVAQKIRRGVLSKQVALETVQAEDRTTTIERVDVDLNAIAFAMDAGDTQQDVAVHRVLLVEDNFPNAKLLLTYLSRLGYEVTWAKDGKEMWNALERSLPAVILMDIHLPDTDGLILTGQLKQHPCYQSIPVIAQTAMAMKGDRAICLEAGANDYISKPIDLDALAQLMVQYAELGTKMT
jgi:signal transduction histidine kinase/CheY-like chemotaxis protein